MSKLSKIDMVPVDHVKALAAAWKLNGYTDTEVATRLIKYNATDEQIKAHTSFDQRQLNDLRREV